MTGGEDTEKPHAGDRWKCPDCGIIVVGPTAPIVRCACGSARMQMRESPHTKEWEAPEWPEDSDYSSDPHDVEADIEYETTDQAELGAEGIE